MSFRESQKRKVSLTHKKADDFIFKSMLDRPISEMSHLRQSLLFAEISMISYLDIEQCNIAAGKIGFTDGKFFNSNGAQAYWFKNKHDSVVVCRGTEANDWNDIEADMNAVTALAETVGKVHRGFKAEVDQIWPHIEKELEANDRPLWFCGHSLGGAMATICAGRATISYIKSEPEGLFTYGSPRVGCRRYANHVKINHSRWVNNNDIVTRVPPAWFGYRHSGAEYYLDRFGNLKDAKGWSRFKDRLKGFLGGLRKGKLDQLSDHSIVEYIDTIHGLARIEGPQLPLSNDSKNEASKPATSSQEPERANQTVSESTPNRQTA